MQHFPSVIPVSSLCHSRENGNPVFLSGSRIKCGMTKRNVDPQSEVLRFRLRMTRGVSFPRKRESSPNGSRIKCGMTKRNVDPQFETLRFRLRMTRGVSFPRKRESSPNGSRIKCGMTGGDGSPIRSALSRIENKHFLTGMARKWNDILRKSWNLILSAISVKMR